MISTLTEELLDIKQQTEDDVEGWVVQACDVTQVAT